MSKPLVIFADAERRMIDRLASAFDGQVYDPTINPNFPSGTLAAPATHLQVQLEAGNADDYPIVERCQVRVTCYTAPGRRDDVKALASLAMGLAYTHPGDDVVAGVRILGGRSDVITDPDTRNLMVWFLAAVDLKATTLAS